MTKRTLSINQNAQESAAAYHPLVLTMKMKSWIVEQMIPLSTKWATSSSSPMVHGFILEITYLESKVTKPMMHLKGLKMMKTKPKVNCKRFGAFFMGGLNGRFFNRSGCIEQCIASLIKGYRLNYVQFMKGLKTECYNTASRIHNCCSAVLQVPKVDLINAEAQKTKFHNWIGWINDGGMGGGSYSAVDVEILHKGYGGEYSLSSIFLNPILIGVCLQCAQD